MADLADTAPEPNVFIFEQDSLYTKYLPNGLTTQWVEDWLDNPDDEYHVNIEHEDDKTIIIQAIEKTEGESYKFMGVK